MANENPSISSEWKENEKISASKPPGQGAKVELTVNPVLTERRIFLFLDSKTTGAGVIVMKGSIIGKQDGTEVFRLPASISDYNSVNQNRSVSSLVNAGGTPVGDSLVLRVGQQLDIGQPIVTLQPFRLNAAVNQLAFEFEDVQDPSGVLTGYHAFLGCLSSRV